MRLVLKHGDAPPPLVAAPFDDGGQRPFERTLRLALAMRGGVSLAVWIGGTVAELDLLRRLRLVREPDGLAAYLLVADPNPGVQDFVLNERVAARAGLYARMLADRGFDRVEVDVLAGASAGGLNSVIYAAAQRAGAAPDEMLRTWTDEGGIWQFLHKPELRPINAPLQGDEYFAPAVNRALLGLSATATVGSNALHRAARVVVDLSATILDREDGLDRGTREGRGHFHFVGAAHPADPDGDPAAEEAAQTREHLRAIPAANASGQAESLARLAYAARSTSSVPGGFEPALISSVASVTRMPVGDRIDMSFAFHAHRTAPDSAGDDSAAPDSAGDEPYRVIDGGLTDNIPIDRAFREIRRMPSDVHSRRALIYLNPEGPTVNPRQAPEPYSGEYPRPDLAAEPPLKPRRDRLSLALVAILGAVAISFGRESGDQEVQDVDDFRRELSLAQGRDQGLAVLVDDLSGVPSVDVVRAYVRFRSSADLDLLTRVLRDPAVWQLGTDLPTRSAFRAVERTQLAALERELQDHYADLATYPESALRQSPVCSGPESLCAAALNVLAWIKTLERSQFEQTGTTGIPLADTESTSVGELRLAAYGVLDAAERRRDEILAGVIGSVCSLPAATSPEIVAVRIRENWLRPEGEKLPGWATLDAIVAVLQRVPGANNTIARSTEWAHSPWRGISARPGLDALDTSAFTAARGLREALLTLDFWEVSANELPAHHRDYVRLLRGQLRAGLRSALSLPPSQLKPVVIDALLSQSDLRPTSKLNGSRFANLSGFLSSEWRRNDWWWGRLDAGAGIARFLHGLAVDPPLGPSHVSVADSVLMVQNEILLHAAGEGQWAPLGRNAAHPAARETNGELILGAGATPDEIRAALARGADSLRNLEPGYRVAVGSQSLRAAVRALDRRGSPWWMHVLLIVLRPLAVFVPLVLDPPRALLTLAVLGGSLVLSAAAGLAAPPEWSGWAALALAAAVLIVAVVRFVSASRHWRQISDILAGLDGEQQERQNEVRRQHQLAAASWSRGMLLGFAFVAAAVLTHPGGAAALVLLLSAVGAFVVAGYRIRTVPANSGYHGRDTVLITVGIVVLLGVALAAPLLGTGISQAVPGFATELLLAVTAGTMSLLTNWGWQAGSHPAQSHPVSSTAVALLSWFAQALLAAVAAGLVCAGLLAWVGSTIPGPVVVAAGLFASGTVQWWLPDLLAWLPRYEPKDLTRRGIR